MRKAITRVLLLTAVLMQAREALSAPPRGTVSRGASTSAGDSLAGQPVECVDFRGGPVLSLQAQHVLADGTIDPEWGADARLCVGATDGVAPLHVSDGAGGAIVIWVDHRAGDADLRVQRFVQGGSVAPAWPVDGVELARGPGAQQDPAACSDGAGGAIVVWQDFRSDGAGDLYAQRIGPDGASLWAQGPIAIAAGIGEQGSATCASDGVGGAFVAWQDRRDGEAGIRLLRLDGNGLIAASDVAIATGSRPHRLARIAGDGAGGAYLAWLAGEGRVLVSRVDALGHPATNWPAAGTAVSAAGAIASAMTLVSHDTAGVSLAWSERTRGNGDILCQRVSANGVVAWTLGGVALTADATEQFAPAAVVDSAGSLIVAWEDHRSGPADIFAARLTSHGELAWDTTGVALCRLPGEQFDVALVSDGAGGAMATWSDARRAARASFARARPAADDPSPRLVSVESGPGRARLMYRTTPGDTRTLDWSRRTTAEAEWTLVRRLQPAADGEVLAEDRTAGFGVVARYRLSQRLGDGEIVYDETSVDIPVAVPLRLRAARVAQGRLLVDFALSADEPASLEVLDVQGRRIWSQPVGHLGAGEHEERFAFDRPAGLYFVRLLQRREARVLRMVLIR